MCARRGRTTVRHAADQDHRVAGARRPCAPRRRANAAPVAKLTAVGARPRASRPGRGVALSYDAERHDAGGRRPVTVLSKATIKVRREKATKGRVTPAIPHGHPAKTYMLRVCLRAGRR